MISDSTAGSRPFFTPSANASLVPLIRMASSMGSMIQTGRVASSTKVLTIESWKLGSAAIWR